MMMEVKLILQKIYPLKYQKHGRGLDWEISVYGELERPLVALILSIIREIFLG